jgi:hypothetical protein
MLNSSTQPSRSSWRAPFLLHDPLGGITPKVLDLLTIHFDHFRLLCNAKDLDLRPLEFPNVAFALALDLDRPRRSCSQKSTPTASPSVRWRYRRRETAIRSTRRSISRWSNHTTSSTSFFRRSVVVYALSMRRGGTTPPLDVHRNRCVRDIRQG